MNIKITESWLREYLKTDATTKELQEYLSLCGPSVDRITEHKNDTVMDIEITSNRVDCASVVGIAQEAAAILPQFGKQAQFLYPQIPEIPQPDKELPITIEDPQNLCGRLIGVVIDNLTPIPSPQFIKTRLEACGIRSINLIVDITNYAMLTWGYPIHAFDYDRIQTHTLHIRNARNGEQFTTLDGKTYTALYEDVVIDDGTGRIIDLPGIMGTENSVVTEHTKRILLFTEHNNPRVIRQTSMRLGIRTEAATINDKNPDPHRALNAISAAVSWYNEFGNSTVASKCIDIFPEKPESQTISSDPQIVNNILGVEIPSDTQATILERLGFTVQQENALFTITVPTHRIEDVQTQEDIVEEIARIYGYHNLPSQIQKTVFVPQPAEIEKLYRASDRCKILLKHLGYNELMSYSMISHELLHAFGQNPDESLRLSNTISTEIEYMRTSLIPSIAWAAKTNAGYESSIKLCELAKIYLKSDDVLPTEPLRLGLITNESYQALKGIIDRILTELKIENALFSPHNHPFFTQNGCAKLQIAGKTAGFFGVLSASHLQNLGITQPLFAAELDMHILSDHMKMLGTYIPPAPHAVISLDHTFENSDLSYSTIENAAQSEPLFLKMRLISRFNNNRTIRFQFTARDKNITEETAKHALQTILSKIS